MKLSPIEKDALREIINISFGLSASLIGDMIDEYVDLQVPNIETIPIYKLHDTIVNSLEKPGSIFVTKQRFFGDFSGEVLFSFSSESAKSFAALLVGEECDDEKEIEGSILELTNILTATCIGKLCEIVDTKSLFAVPDVQKISSSGSSALHEALEYDNAIVITTILDVAKQNIQAYMFILFNNKMLTKLLKTLKESSLC